MTIDRETLQLYLSRDWAAIRDAKRRYWRERLDHGGLAEALRVTEQLRVGAPTEKQRDEDLETHQRVAKALQKTAPQGLRAPTGGLASRVR